MTLKSHTCSTHPVVNKEFTWTDSFLARNQTPLLNKSRLVDQANKMSNSFGFCDALEELETFVIENEKGLCYASKQKLIETG